MKENEKIKKVNKKEGKVKIKKGKNIKMEIRKKENPNRRNKERMKKRKNKKNKFIPFNLCSFFHSYSFLFTILSFSSLLVFTPEDMELRQNIKLAQLCI